MKLKKLFGKVTALLLTCVLCAPATSAFAEGAVKVDTPSSLTLSYMDGTTALSGITTHVYKVASVDESGNFTKLSTFDSYSGTDLNALTTSELARGAADTLKALVAGGTIADTASLTTDTSGKNAFSNLSTGLYLVTTDNMVSGYNTYTFSAVLISLPTADNGEWVYNVMAEPKQGKTTTTPGGGGGGGGGGSSSSRSVSSSKISTIPATEVPRGTIDIGEEQIPLASLPKTWESSKMLPIVVLAGVVLLCLGWVIRAKDEKEAWKRRNCLKDIYKFFGIQE